LVIGAYILRLEITTLFKYLDNVQSSRRFLEIVNEKYNMRVESRVLRWGRYIAQN